MSYLYIKHHHLLDDKESRSRAEKIAEYLRKKYGVNYIWKGNRLISKYRGCSISVNLNNHAVEIRVKLGLLLSPARAKIDKVLRANLHSVYGDREATPGQFRIAGKHIVAASKKIPD